MAYDLAAFAKTFVGTQLTANNANVNLSNGFVVTAGLSSQILLQTSATVNSNYGVGTFGMFDKNYKSVTIASGVTGCCTLMLIAAPIYTNDKLSPFIGGYNETNKSKGIQPRNITQFKRFDPCTPQQHIIHIGNTKYTKSLSPANAACSYSFLCGETYSIRFDIKGSPALRALNHNLQRTVDFYTGCCPGVVPTNVDSTLVMIGWANLIVGDPLLSLFISPIVYSEAGVAYYPPGTVGQTTWDTYVSPGQTPGKTAGMRLIGAYTDTNFKDCTFQVSDFFEREPIRILASQIDYEGDPCEFSGICVVTECPPLQGLGFGETIVRELILSEDYRQRGFNSDFRVREITQGDQILAAINRRSTYYKYSLIYHIVRNANPTAPASNDQYRLEIICSAPNTAFEALMSTWLTACADCQSLETFSCSPCTPLTP